jgi:hypothetical protein
MAEEKIKELLLEWDGSGFIPSSTRGSGIYLQLNTADNTWIFQYSDEVGFIARRTALRRANETARVGFVDPSTGGKVGISFTCIEEKDPYHNLPSKVTRAEHDFNS